MHVNDERTPREIDDQVMEALLALASFAISSVSPQDAIFRTQIQANLGIIKDGVAELVRRAEAA